MNVFGIDYGRAASLLVLREGDALVRSLSDGERTLVPHAVTGTTEGASDAPPGAWGSRAVTVQAQNAARKTTNGGGSATAHGGGVLPPSMQAAFDAPSVAVAHNPAAASGDLRPGPWTDDADTGLFWRGVYDRLYRYLGRMEPTEYYGYRVAVAVTAETNDTGALHAVSRLASAAGLHDADVVSAAHALVGAWAASGQYGPAPETLNVVAVAVGDTGTEVGAFHFTPPTGSGSPPRIERADTGAFLPVGEAHWIARLVGELRSRLRETPPPGQELLVNDAARAWGAALGRTDNAHDNAAPPPTVNWDGPFRERLYTPLRLSVRDCLRDWPEARTFTDQLPGIMRLAALNAGAKTGVPDVIVIGGRGANWPFAVRAALLSAGGNAQTAPQPRLWHGGDEAVARGATWLPEWGAASPPAASPPAARSFAAKDHADTAASGVAASPISAAYDLDTSPPPSASLEQTPTPPSPEPVAPDANLPPSLRRFDF